MSRAIGIDLGTTNSVAAVEDGRVQVLTNRMSQSITPSVVAYRRPRTAGKAGEILVGHAAINIARLAPEELVERPRGGAPLEPAFAGVDLAQALDQQPRRHLLEHHPLDPQADRLDDVVLVEARGQEHHPRRRALGVELPQHRQAVLAAHAEVEQQEVGPQLAHRLERLVAVDAARHHLELRLQAEELLEPVEEDRVVVGEDDADAHRSGRRMSRRAPASLEWMRSEPPAAAIRCLSVTGPSLRALSASKS